MKISPINAVNVKKVRLQKNVSNPVKISANSNIYNNFNVYMGKDLVSFRGSEFQQTLKNNYFQLPEGCYPDAFQIDAGKALLAGKDVLVEAPTGTGKTAIAHYAATKNMAEGKTTFYTTPLKALSNQKLNEFRKVYGDENVGILTGDRRENVEAPIIIMTTEVYRNMALSNMYGDENPLMKNLGTVIFDEFHYLGDPDRGPVWEESVMFTPKDVQTLELSATIGNPKELEKWIGDLKGDNVSLISIPSEARHVPLSFDMISTKAYEKSEKQIEKALKRGETLSEDAKLRVSKPKLSDFKSAVETLNEKKQLPAILFIFSRNYSRELLEYMAKEGLDLTNDKEKEEIDKILVKYNSEKYIGADLDTEALRKGYAIHNAGIIPGQKELIEELFQKKLLKVVVATETLAAGINMPAKTVVISSPYKPCDVDTDAGKLIDEDADVKLEKAESEKGEETVPVRLLTSNEFKQMAGRAGRRGIDTIGYVYTMPTNRTTEQDFLYLEATDCNPINSNYNPDYAFISGYYEHNDSPENLEEIFDKTFYTHSNDKELKNTRTQELIEISERKTQILKDRGFLVEEDGVLVPTMLTNMASKVRGYDALNLTETIASKTFEGMSAPALAMIAGSIALPARKVEGQVTYTTDMSQTFVKTNDAVSNIYQRLNIQVSSMLLKFGKTMDDFESYQDMLEFAQSIEKPEISEEEATMALKRLEEKRAKMYKITKTSGNYTPEELVYALNVGEIVPSKVLEEHLDAVERYKKKVNSKDIERHILRLQVQLEELDSSSKGKKAKARIDRQKKEIEQDIRIAQNMKYLEENIADALAENYRFIRQNPPEQIKRDYSKQEREFSKLTLKDALVNKISAIIALEENVPEGDEVNLTGQDEQKVNSAFKKLIKNSLDIYSTEINNGINAVESKLNKDAAQMLYAWTSLNEANPVDTMSNWEQLVRMVPETVADEGSIYRTIMQSADLLSQIGEMAQVGYSMTKDEYYADLMNTAREARELVIQYPISV